MNCELCGFSDKRFFEVDIDGSRMTVCSDCAKSGHIIKEVMSEEARVKSPLKEVSFVADYEKVLSNAAAENKLSINEIAEKLRESPSTIEKVFSGKILPNGELSRKLEKLLNVKLSEEVSYKLATKNNEHGLIIEDVVEIKRKQR